MATAWYNQALACVSPHDWDYPSPIALSGLEGSEYNYTCDGAATHVTVQLHM